MQRKLSLTIAVESQKVPYVYTTESVNCRFLLVNMDKLNSDAAPCTLPPSGYTVAVISTQLFGETPI